MSDDELLRESISRLEQALLAEQTRRDEAESTLAGIRCITDATDLAATDRALVGGLRSLLGYQAAALVRPSLDDPETFVASFADHPALVILRWPSGPLRTRVLAGQTAALYDVQRSPELAALAESSAIRAALCVPLSTAERDAILLGVHDQPAYFSQRQVALARGFSRTAIRVLESLDAREHAHQRLQAAREAASLGRSNLLLREQIATIQAQQIEIRRLRAPILRVAAQTLVLPLTGDLDHDALVHIRETLLQRIREHRARCVILDLTGFESTDPGIHERVQSLTRTVALLGARCLLSGLRPATALALADTTFDAPAYATLADALAARPTPPNRVV